MNEAHLKSMTIPQLIERYTSMLLQQYTVRDHHNAQGKRDVGPWNRLADQVEAIHRELKTRGEAGIDAMLPLIHHSNPKVSYAAAVHCLRQRPAQVLPVLEQMARTNDWSETKVDPEGALEMWREGKWVVD
jgi:hypothetical protein